MTMSDEKDDEKKKEEDEPVKQLAEGIGMLLKAAKGAAKGLKKELDKTTVSKVFEDAGREFARAATNVVEQVSAEISGKKKHESHAPPPHEHHEEHEHAAPKAHDEADEFDGVKPKPKGPTPEDPGFRIAVDDDSDDKKSG
jgi:Sec-independent protein translocase protein TatA